MEDAEFLTELYEIVKQNKSGVYTDVILEKASYPYLYHLSDIRHNLIGWLKMDEGMHVLERNAECGALTGKLLERAGSVVSVTDGELRAAVIQERCREYAGRLKVLCADAWERRLAEAASLEPRFDLILIAGSTYRFEAELARLHGLLKEGGRLVIADANRLGLKYFAGCQEEYRGGYFTGIAGYEAEASGDESPCAGRRGAKEPGRCRTRGEYTQMLSAAGFTEPNFYYPYPDHKFPSEIYSDDWLPHRGALADGGRNFERDRIECFDERKVFDTLIAEGLFGAFSNSFLIEVVK